MSGGHIPQDHYEAKGDAAKWVEHRLPMGGLVSHLNGFPTPKNLNWMWVFGALLVVCLVIQIATGVALAMHYTAHIDTAFGSLQHIIRDVNAGWWLQSSHAIGASFFFIAVYFHIFRGIFYGSYKAPREILWIIGVLIYVLMMATAFMGYVLPWGQMSFWGAAVITNLFGAVPLVGGSLLEWLQGGFSVDNATLTRFFALHYLLPFAIAGLVVLHIWALHHVGNNNPTGVPVRTDNMHNVKRDTVPFSPYYTVKDGFAIVIFLLFFAGFVYFAPDYLGHAENYIEANPLVTPAHIVPEWYFLPFYAILRAIPDKLMGVIAMFSAIAVLALLPWLDTSRVRSGAYRPMFKQFFWVFVVVCILLGYVGAKNPDDAIFAFHGEHREFAGTEEAAARAYQEELQAANPGSTVTLEQVVIFGEVSETGAPIADRAPWVVDEVTFAFTYLIAGRILTFMYFAFFLVVIPVLGIVERTRPLPANIDADFKARKGTAPQQQTAGMGGSAQPAE